MIVCSSCLGRMFFFLSESLKAGDVSQAWLVWSRAAETALADAYCFSGCPAPSQCWVHGRGMARLRLDADDFFLYRNSSIAPLLDMRRRFRAVMGVLDSMIRGGIFLARFVELTAQWDRIIAVGHLYPDTFDDLHAVQGLEEDPFVYFYKWLRPDLIFPAPFLPFQPHFTPGCSGVVADEGRIDEEFRKAWLPYFCRSGQRGTSLEELTREVEGWLPILPEFQLPRLTDQMLAVFVLRKSATAGSIDGWGWRE